MFGTCPKQEKRGRRQAAGGRRQAAGGRRQARIGQSIAEITFDQDQTPSVIYIAILRRL